MLQRVLEEPAWFVPMAEPGCAPRSCSPEARLCSLPSLGRPLNPTEPTIELAEQPPSSRRFAAGMCLMMNIAAAFGVIEGIVGACF
jgi:hypothetical protein